VQGAAQLESEHRPVVWLTHGDIVGPWQLGSSVLALATSQNESCELLGFAPDDIWGVLQHDPSKSWAWAAYQSTLCSRLFAEFVELKASSVAPQPHFKRFQRGETIILEGDEGDDVFVLAQGLAKVTRRGTHIGEIYQDEIFGALAALTDSVRTATVVASEPCDCMVFRKEEFRDLLRANPELMDKLFYDFGRALHDLNDSVQKAHHNKWRNLF
jgi:CRP-like cAMP-binding protein